jgi:microcystin-dependent protein
MGSALYLSGGVQSTDRLVKTISQAHTFKIGDVLRFDVASGQYIKAQANSAFNSEVVGVVSAISPVNFTLTISGQIDDLNSVSYLAGITSPVLFLSGSTAGQVTPNPPSAIGSVIKPILIRNQTTQTYVVNNFLGTQIGGSSTVSIDEIQPVGTIMPYAGSVIPETWLACNGNSYALTSYPELFSKCTYQTGEQTPLYGHVVQMQFSSGSATWHGSVQVGDYVIINQAAVTPTTAAYDLIGIVLNKTAPLLSGSLGLTVQIVPKYSTTTKTFSIANKRVVGTSAVVAYAEVGLTTIRGAAGSQVGTVNTVTITHFNTPDLRGRVALGVNQTTLADLEDDATNISAISGIYPLGSEGGEEKHTLTTAEMPAHDHPQNATENTGEFYWVSNETLPAAQQENINTTPSGWEFSRRNTVASQGGDAPHNNMPPYLAVQYIIKAKPYTRAAIIDGVDLPYERLLIRDTNANSLETELLSGFSGGDLVFYTSSGETTKLGTERMRLANSGNLGLGTASPVAKLDVRGGPVIINEGGRYPSSTISLFYNRLFVGGTGAALVVWDDGMPSTGATGTILIGAKSPVNSTILAGGVIRGGNETTTDSTGYLAFYTTPSDGSSSVERMRIDSTGKAIHIASVTDFGAANRANLVVGNGVVGGSRQLQFGVSDTHNCAWIMGWLNGSGGQTLSIQPLGGMLCIGATAGGFVNDPTTFVGINGDLTIREANVIMNVDFRTRSNSGYARGLLYTDGFSPEQTGSYKGVTAGIGLYGTVTNKVNTPSYLYMGFGSNPWGQNRGIFIKPDGKVGFGTVSPLVTLDVVGEARSSTSTTAASNAKTLVTKDYVDSKAFTFTYGNTTYSTTGFTNIVGHWNNDRNYFDVFPPAGKAMSDLIAFIPSIAVVHYAGDVDGNDSIRCTWGTYADRIRVWVQNTEQRSTPAANWLAVWR